MAKSNIKKQLSVGIITAIIVGVILIVVFNYSSSTFLLENKEDGSFTITAKNAGENSGGVGEITLQEGQKLEVKANLKKESSIKVKATTHDTDNNEETAFDESFKQTEEREFELPSGSYNIFVTAEKGATGNMTINVK